MSEQSRQLSLVDKARQQLAEATSIDEVKEIRDRAEALREYAKVAGLGLEAQNHAAEVKICAERRAGEMLAENVQRGGDRKSKFHDGTLKLTEIGVDKKQSHRWQRIAGIPEDIFQRHIRTTLDMNKELTSASLQSLAKSLIKEAKQEEAQEADDSANVESDLLALCESGKKFRTIYADPPWQYGNQVTRASTNNHYRTMTVDEIAALPIHLLADNEAHLHLWTTNGFLFDAKQVIEAWGFEYKSCFVWVKPQMGIGNYWRVSHEFMLLGVRGGLGFRDKAQKSWIEEKRTRHSQKPESVRYIIEKVSEPPYLELFGRQASCGWTTWGNQVDRDIQEVLCGE